MKLLKYISVVSLLILSGCDGYNKKDPFIIAKDYHSVGHYTLQYGIEIIDGCEYFIIPGANRSLTFCHKGNCTNNIHVYNTQKAKIDREEMVKEFMWLEKKIQGLDHRLTMFQMGKTDTNDPIYMGTLNR